MLVTHSVKRPSAPRTYSSPCLSVIKLRSKQLMEKPHHCGSKVSKMCTQLQASAHWLTGICVVIPYGVS